MKRLLVAAWRRLMGTDSLRAQSPLPVLVHSHHKDSVPPGPLEDGMIALDQDDYVLHALEGVIRPDGTIGELSYDRLEWACRLSYRHLLREGCLEAYGIPRNPGYETDPEIEPG